MLIPDQTPHSHSFALLVIQSLDDGTIPNSMVEIGLALVLLPLSPLIATIWAGTWPSTVL